MEPTRLAHQKLDQCKIPRHDPSGAEYSLPERVLQLTTDAEKHDRKMAEIGQVNRQWLYAFLSGILGFFLGVIAMLAIVFVSHRV